LIWNPLYFEEAEFESELKEFRKKGSVTFEWNCSRTTGIEAGDRIFLMRVGEEPRGLIGSGYALRKPNEATRWDDETRTTHYVDVQWDWIDPEPLILRAELDQPEFAGVRWSPQSSGILIKGDAAENLEQAWAARRAARGAVVK
jgi:5-methylcytosine-specific restriction protein A